MTRVKPVTTRDDMAPEFQHLFDQFTTGRQQGEPGRLDGPASIMLLSPKVAELGMPLGHYLRLNSVLTRQESELAIITVAREAECEYVWGIHMVAAPREGLREEAIAVIRDRLDLSRLEPDETAIVTYVQQLVRKHRVDQAVFDGLLKTHGLPWLVELTALVGQYSLLACMMNAFEVPARPGAQQLPK